MKFSGAVSLLSLLSIASAATSFSVVSIRSGSGLQYASLKNKDGTIYVGSGDDVELAINDDGTLVDAKTKKYIDVKDNFFVEGYTGTKKVSIKGGYLVYEDKEVFAGCPDGDSYKLNVNNTCTNGLGIRLRITNEKKIDDIKVEKPASSSSSATKKPATTTTSKKPASSTTSKKLVSTTCVCVPIETKSGASAKPTGSASSKTDAPTPTGKITFGVISVKSGTKFQYAPIKKVDSHVHVFAVGGDEGKDVTLTLHPDGTLTDQDGRQIRINENGEFGDTDPWGEQKPSTRFAITDGHLTLNGKDNWKACPSGDNKYSLANNDCTGGTGIALHVIDPKPAK